MSREIADKNVSGLIFDIKTMSVADGPGIRTTVFVKGCPLRCTYCHNPESQRLGYELMCRDADDKTSLQWVRSYNRRSPVDRQDLPSLMPAGNASKGLVELVGRRVTAAEVVRQVVADRLFFERSGGGLTLSGGDPLAQTDFSVSVLEQAQSCGLHTVLDTSAVGPIEDLERLLDATDLVHLDVKETRSDRYRRLTGADLEGFAASLELMERRGARVTARCPIVPGVNDEPEHLDNVARLAEGYDCVSSVDILPYHSYGLSKYARLGRFSALPSIPTPDREVLKAWAAQVAARTRKPVRIV